MHKIKQIPEDFIVKEISNVKFGERGDYSYFSLKKENYSTVRAIEHIAQALRIKPKNIGFAGNKDKNAITEQVISFFKVNENKIKNLKLRDIELKFLGKGNSPVSLGDLEGNHFEIVVRDLDSEDISAFNKKINKKIKIPNYFGEQRFSYNNHLVGKAIIKNDFKKAVELILENKGDFEERIKDYLKTNKNDHIGAINLVPFKIRKLYVHAYQSYLFNKTIDLKLKNKKIKKNQIKNKINQKIPVMGFGTETQDKEIDKITNNLLKKENIDLRDFIIKQIPALSSEGDSRDLFFEINDLKVIEINKDELNKNKKKIRLSFSLKKGCYATVALSHLFNQDSQDLL